MGARFGFPYFCTVRGSTVYSGTYMSPEVSDLEYFPGMINIQTFPLWQHIQGVHAIWIFSISWLRKMFP